MVHVLVKPPKPQINVASGRIIWRFRTTSPVPPKEKSSVPKLSSYGRPNIIRSRRHRCRRRRCRRCSVVKADLISFLLLSSSIDFSLFMLSSALLAFLVFFGLIDPLTFNHNIYKLLITSLSLLFKPFHQSRWVRQALHNKYIEFWSAFLGHFSTCSRNYQALKCVSCCSSL